MIDSAAKAKLRRLMEARVSRDEAKAALDAAEKDFRQIEAEVYEALEESGLDGTVKIDLGPPYGKVSFRTRETYYGRIIDDEKALDYFEERAMMDEFTAPKFVKARLNEIVRERIEAGEEMPPGVDYYPNRGVTITRAK